MRFIMSFLSTSVSIHAPWEGCDTSNASNAISKCPFQFTHPGKGATLGEMPKQEAMTTFQFTHPGKGATRRVKLLRRRLKVSIHAPWEGCDIALRPSTTQYPVSIHAPWEGCDNSSCNSRLSLHQFQFTHPGKGATVVLPISL